MLERNKSLNMILSLLCILKLHPIPMLEHNKSLNHMILCHNNITSTRRGRVIIASDPNILKFSEPTLYPQITYHSNAIA